MEQEREYQRVARLIREELAGREVGAPLDSERDYEVRFKVARGTVRRGLSELERSGEVRNVNGVRTLRGRRRWRWDMTVWERLHRPGADAWKVSMLEQGAETAESAIRVEHIASPADVAAALDILEGTPIITRERLHLINGDPEQLSQSFYPPWVSDGHPEFTLPGDVSVPGGLLAHSGHKQVRYTDLHTPRPPTAEEAARLQMADGELLQVVARTGYDAAEKPVRHIRLQMPAERSVLIYDLSAE